MAGTLTKIKAETIGMMINQILGFTPKIDYGENYAEISFTPDQQKIVQAYIEKQIDTKRPPGEIRINLLPILWPLILKKSIPFLAGAAGIGFMIGKRKKK